MRAQLALALFQFAILAVDLVFVDGNHLGHAPVRHWWGITAVELMFLADLLAYMLSWLSFRVGVFATTAALMLTFVLSGSGTLGRWLLALLFCFLKLGPILILTSLAVMTRKALMAPGVRRQQQNKGNR